MGYDPELKKHRVLLARADSRHLDTLLDEELDDWVRR